MEKLFGLLVVMATLCSGNCEEVNEVKSNTQTPPPEVRRSSGRSRALLVNLGGSEEQLMTSRIASLLLSRDYDVTVFLYGGDGAGHYPRGTEIVEIPLDESDPIYAPIGGEPRYVIPSQSDTSMYDVMSPGEQSSNQQPSSSYDVTIASSRRLACKQLLLNTTWSKEQISRAKIFVTPLHLHDLCTLTFARQFDLPVVGLMTSRLGSWWTWHWLDLLPSLATSAVPPNIMLTNFGFMERITNLFRFWSYMSTLERDWVEPLMRSLPTGTLQPISDLYITVDSVLVAWDWLTDADLPMTPFLTSLVGLQLDRSEDVSTETIMASPRLRNGAVFCNLKIKELWVGFEAQRAILRALAATPYAVVCRGVQEAREDVQDDKNRTRHGKEPANLVFEEDPPIAALLAHPRHRLLISMCGESDANAAILLGSPTLCLPVTPDQMLTSTKLRDLGLALVVQAGDVTTNRIKDAVRELTNNKSYRSRGRQIAEEYREQPLSPSDRVIHALEKLVRRPWRYKRKETQRLSLLAKSNGDVTAAIMVCVTSLVCVAVWVVIVFVRAYRGIEKEKKKDD